ncbi:type IV pilin protein [Anaeromyxobacter oryzae]|uniref:Zinc ribbon domain-containing protein n=1 Tax=Anaeromyxobacter oryzae TaxID=2918170 RepID=A0ABM7WRL5_9BACT|nr:prepilin-type N-terminal cleavage/methylation domain-containing protein [Anaeromyxobacter oryzae]BDG02118.1 hypothetical protein AMOR_11140 [Anaeromyxobacter oryzae]
MANQPAMQLGPNFKYCTACAHVLDAHAAFCGRCGVPQGPPALSGPPPLAPPRSGGSSAATIVAVVIACLFGGVVILGILAAIAIPNFLRYQLRAKQAGVQSELVSIALAEQGLHARGRPYSAFPDPVPADAPGARKVALSDADRAAAAAIGWSAPRSTYGRYDVAVITDAAGNQSFSVCAESDLDGDGNAAAIVWFHPGTTVGGAVLAPPLAPCEGAVVKPGRSLDMTEDDPADQPIRISPHDVF